MSSSEIMLAYYFVLSQNLGRFTLPYAVFLGGLKMLEMSRSITFYTKVLSSLTRSLNGWSYPLRTHANADYVVCARKGFKNVWGFFWLLRMGRKIGTFIHM